MIIVRFTSGLGNQMFQYNFLRLLQEKYPDTEVKADVSWMYRNDPHHGYELPVVFPFMEKMGCNPKIATFSEIKKVTGQIPGLFKNHFLAQKWVYLTGPINSKMASANAKMISEQVIDDSVGILSDQIITNEKGEKVTALYEKVMNLDPSRDYYIASYFASEMYYLPRVDRLSGELVFDEPIDEYNKNILADIDESCSVSVHLRRGDYLLPENSDKFCLLGNDYYTKAVEYIKNQYPESRFFIFSDDIPYAKQMFSYIENAVYVTGNSGASSYRDMQLMSRCQHNIIANSTFSQWAALLNKNEKHITVYPSTYLKGEDTEDRKILNWVRI